MPAKLNHIGVILQCIKDLITIKSYYKNLINIIYNLGKSRKTVTKFVIATAKHYLQPKRQSEV